MRFQNEQAVSHKLSRYLSSISKTTRNLRLFLLLGLLQSLLYVFLIPPWHHYDEPGHFEFAWQLAHFDHWPEKNEWDENMRRQLAASMLQYGYYNMLPPDYIPDFTSDKPVFIGVAPQHTEYPLYYLIVSLPLRFLKNADFAVQNRLLRLMSAMMFLITIWITWQVMGELVPAGHPLQQIITLFVTLLPGFADTMTSINDDVGAVLMSSLFIWASLRMLRYGFSWQRFVAVIFATLACYWTKTTAWFALPLLPVVLLLSFHRMKHSLILVLGLIGIVAISIFSVRWGDARFWYRLAPQNKSTRVSRSEAPIGNYVFDLSYSQDQKPWLVQLLNRDKMHSLQGKTISLGAWMWATSPTVAYLPFLQVITFEEANMEAGIVVIRKVVSSPYAVQLKTTPEFYVYTFDIPHNAEYGLTFLIPFIDPKNPKQVEELFDSNPTDLDIQVTPQRDNRDNQYTLIPPPEEQPVDIYYDGLILAEGKRTGIPVCQDRFCQSGIWGGVSFVNYLKGASAETAWFWLNSRVTGILGKAFPGSRDILFASLQEWPLGIIRYSEIVFWLTITFWGHLAGAKVYMLGTPAIYALLIGITVFGIASALIYLFENFQMLHKPEILFLGFVLTLSWGITIAREGSGLLVIEHSTWARYAFPSMIPTALLLSAGWYIPLRKLFRLSTQKINSIFFLFFLCIDALAIATLIHHFYW